MGHTNTLNLGESRGLETMQHQVILSSQVTTLFHLLILLSSRLVLAREFLALPVGKLAILRRSGHAA